MTVSDNDNLFNQASELLFGKIAIQKGFATPEELEDGLRTQKEMQQEEDTDVPRLGEILLEKGYIEVEEIQKIAHLQSERRQEQEEDDAEMAGEVTDKVSKNASNSQTETRESEYDVADTATEPGTNQQLMSCPDCGDSVSPRAPQCPHCGCPIDQQSGQNWNIMGMLGGLGIVLGIALIKGIGKLANIHIPYDENLGLLVLLMSFGVIVYSLVRE